MPLTYPKPTKAEFTIPKPAVFDEYTKLSTLPSLSEEQADRMMQILEQAESNPNLNFWINEFDYCLYKSDPILSESKSRTPCIQI